jgi:cytochrome c peroxidase
MHSRFTPKARCSTRRHEQQRLPGAAMGGAPLRSATGACLERVAATAALLSAIGCGGQASSGEPLTSTGTQDLSSHHSSSGDSSSGDSSLGERLFDQPFAHTNGRSCASCHLRDQHTTLLPSHVEELLASDPEDPLFNPIDADDPAAASPSYEHLKKGLVRVVLPLADNLDVIDAAGNVVTSADRTIAVWRGVPSVENTAISAPYQYDGRAPTLQVQAQGAILAHSQGRVVRDRALDAIAELEASLFTSERARFVFDRLADGDELEQIPDPENYLQLSAAERRGKVIFDQGCAPCHGSATTHHIENQVIHDFAFFELTPAGFVRFDVQPGQPPTPIPAPHANEDFLPGYGILAYLGQVGAFPAFTASVQLPHYRLRFYADGTRSQVVTELPPPLRTLSGDPSDPQPALDENGAPLVGTNLVPQAFSTDPGRAIITGDPHDFEAVDVPQLRGIADTAPYFHDNSVETLSGVVDVYSRFVLGALSPLGLPATNPPETPATPPEALSPDQKRDLLQFLQRL